MSDWNLWKKQFRWRRGKGTTESIVQSSRCEKPVDFKKTSASTTGFSLHMACYYSSPETLALSRHFYHVHIYVIVQVFARFGKISGRVWSNHGLYFCILTKNVNWKQKSLDLRSFIHALVQARTSFPHLGDRTPTKISFGGSFVMNASFFPL